MVQGFERAMREYEHHLTCPYDEGGALYEEDYDEYEDYMETQADYAYERERTGT